MGNWEWVQIQIFIPSLPPWVNCSIMRTMCRYFRVRPGLPVGPVAVPRRVLIRIRSCRVNTPCISRKTRTDITDHTRTMTIHHGGTIGRVPAVRSEGRQAVRPMVCEYDTVTANRHNPRLVERLPVQKHRSPGGAGTTYQ